VVHHTLKGCGGITKPEWHNFGFEESLFCFHHCNPLAAGVDSDVVIPIPDIEFRHQFGLFHLVKDDINPGQGIHVGDGPLINFLIVIDWSSLFTLLFNIEERA
jgi:hypothetical protein